MKKEGLKISGKLGIDLRKTGDEETGREGENQSWLLLHTVREKKTQQEMERGRDCGYSGDLSLSAVISLVPPPSDDDMVGWQRVRLNPNCRFLTTARTKTALGKTKPEQQ